MENTKEKASSEVRPEEKAAENANSETKENSAEKAKMEVKVHENAEWKANAEGQGQWPKRTWHRRPKPKAKENALRDDKNKRPKGTRQRRLGAMAKENMEGNAKTEC